MVVYDDYGVPTAYSEPETLTRQAYRTARAFAIYRVKPIVQRGIFAIRHGNWTWRGLVTAVRVLVLVWFVVLYWGERMVFKDSIDACRWQDWENWVCSITSLQNIVVVNRSS
jgi:hypothetical protein